LKVGTSSGQGPYHIQAEINMIPLIDVSLVLLIIFMVISPILVQSQLKVNLPKVTTNANQAEETALKVEIDAEGRISYDGNIVSRAQLKNLLQQDLPPGHNAALLIHADGDVAFNDVVYVMDLAKKFKVEKLGVSVLPEFRRP